MDNRALACHLRAHANHLEEQERALYRVRAYRRAADTIEMYPRSLAKIYEESGRGGLLAIPDVGDHLAYSLEGLLTTGEFRTLRPEGAAREPDRQLNSLPGIGVHLALRLREQLGISSVEELERAAHEGRLAAAGIGPRRLERLRAAFAQRRHEAASPIMEPDVAELLRLDDEFRRQHRPLPWLPEQAGFRYHVDFCRRALAHRLRQTRDWVSIRFESAHCQGERLVATETEGDLAGRRVVRGREQECREYYRVAAACGSEGTQCAEAPR